VVVGNNLDRRLCTIRHVHSGRNADRAETEVPKAVDCELLLRDDAESVSWVVTNSHVYRDIGLRVLHVQLNGSAIDGEVGALLLNIVVASAGEGALGVL
jgi:hypothetical protein